MGKGHKDRRREKRARELEELQHDEHALKEKLQEETDKKNEEYRLIKKQNEEQSIRDKLIESSSDTNDSGQGSSVTASIDSLKISKSAQKDESIENKKYRSLIKGLYNIGNTCFFNVIIQSLAHTPLLIDTMYETIECLIADNEKKHPSNITTHLLNVFDQFTSKDCKKPSIDPKPLFNSLIKKIPSYEGYDQHDSHELFMNLMLILRAEEIQLKQLKTRRRVALEYDDDLSKMFCLIGCNEPYTTYDSIFGGHLLDVITCQKCGKALMKIEPFLGLLLPLTDRISPSENYRNRRKRDNDYRSSKSNKEPKLLSRKQQKALKKQEKKNSKRSARVPSGKIKSRQSAKTNVVQEQLPLEETPSVSSPDEAILVNEQHETNESIDTKTENSIQEKKESETVDTNDDDKEADQEEEKQQQQNGEDSNEDDNDDDDDDDDDGEEKKPKGPLTSTESICMLADMVSKLTLIHETSSHSLPFVDESIAKRFLDCPKTSNDSLSTNETDDINKLEQCFERYFKSESLSGENLFDCYHCRSLDPTQQRVLTEATRQTVFFQLPPILPVFLKRFQMFSSRSEKLNKFIEFPLQLYLTNHCSSQVISNSSIYSLYAVIEHSGTLRSGHYIAYIKQSIDDNDLSKKTFSKPIDYLLENLFKTTTDEQSYTNSYTTQTVDPSVPPTAWYHVSDNTIHKVPENKVLEANAYVLFYRKISSKC